MEELRGALDGLQQRAGNSEAIARAANEANKGLEQLSEKVERRMAQLEVAVQEGATLVRIGTDLFGAREKP